MSKVDLRIDWATHEAAKYACENWHYSRCVPKSKLSKVGVWENEKFIGVVIFGSGASPQISSPYRLKKDEVCELVRVALKEHQSPVSRIVSIAFKFLSKANPNLKLVVSYADPLQGHTGGIYQAGNWIYTGITAPCEWFREISSGRMIHSHSYRRGKRGKATRDKLAGIIESVKLIKHKYLMPLDAEMREKVLPLAKPYPKRMKQANSGDQSESGGAAPTHALQSLQDAII